MRLFLAARLRAIVLLFFVLHFSHIFNCDQFRTFMSTAEISTVESRTLTPRESALLQAVIDTYYPEILPQANDDSGHFRRHARRWPLVGQISQIFSAESAESWTNLRDCLTALSRPWQAWWSYPRWRSFEKLPLSERGMWLARFESRVPSSWRLVLQSIRRLMWETVYGPENGISEASSIVPGENQNHPDRIADWWQSWQDQRSDATDRATRNAGLQASPLRPGQTTLACDYLVIGSGAAGAVMAAELAETGRRVLLVERAALVDREHFLWPPASSLVEMWGRAACPSLPVHLQTANAWGGSTLAAEPGLLDPLPNQLLHWAEKWGFEAGLSENFRHSLYTVRRRLELQERDDDDDPSTRTWLENSGLALGFKMRRAHSSCALANSACELCTRGCPSGDWADARNTYLMDAQRLGVYLLPGCEVTEFEVEDEQAVAARAWLLRDDGSREEITIRFRNAVLCAGAIHSPRILQRSGLRQPAIGQRLRLHPSLFVAAEMPDNRHDIALDRMLVAHPTAFGHAAEHCELRPVPVNPLRASLALPFRNAVDHKRLMQRWERMVLIQVTLKDSGNGFVCGVPRGRQSATAMTSSLGHRDTSIQYRLTKIDRERLLAGANAAVYWLRAAGCPLIFSPWDPQWRLHEALDDRAFSKILQRSQRTAQRGQLPPLWSAHASSTCRLGDSPMRGAVDRHGTVFGLVNVYIADASILPTATSSDPRLLITTLSHYLAQDIKTLTQR